MSRLMERPILVPHDKVVCRYYLRSSCREGDGCYFSHDATTACIPDRVCRYFLQHKCEYGPLCKFEHVRIQRPPHVKIGNRNQKNVKGSCEKDSGAANTTKRESAPKSSLVNSCNMSLNENRASCDNKNRFTSTIAGKYIPHFGWFDPDVILSTWSYGDTSASDLCSHFMYGSCPFGEKCPYTHGLECELCGTACLSPDDEEQRRSHTEQCEKDLIADMELSFAIQRSSDKSCGICMETILEKNRADERRFGIMENCNHVFCLSCIRKWRKTKQDERTEWDPVNTRLCPHCRVPSDFIVPSKYWFDSEKDKDKLISDFKESMARKPCKYFKQGEETCPFGGLCFYLHAKPDGTKVELPPPTRRRRQSRRANLDDVDSIALSLWLSQIDDEEDNENGWGLTGYVSDFDLDIEY